MITYDLSVEVMFLNHNNINCSGILESQEPETAGTTAGAVAHDGAFEDFAELGEVVFE